MLVKILQVNAQRTKDHSIENANIKTLTSGNFDNAPLQS